MAASVLHLTTALRDAGGRIGRVLDALVAAVAASTGHEVGVTLRAGDRAVVAGQSSGRVLADLPIPVDERTRGTLTLYARPAAAGAAGAGLSDSDRAVAAACAAVAGAALADARRDDGLREALRTRDVIGQAKGILMERHGISADEAFGLLSTASQNANRKLAEMAADLVTTGDLGATTRTNARD